MKLLQINPVVRVSTSTGRIMQEVGELAMENGWESYIAYSYGRDGEKPCASELVPVGNRLSVAWHGIVTRLTDRHGLSSDSATRAFIERIKEIKPDIVHIHNIHGYFLNYKMLFDFLSKSDVQVIWTVHDCWLYTGHCYHYSFARCYKWQSGCGNCPQRAAFPASWFVDRSARNFCDKRAAFTSVPKERLTIVPVSEWIGGELKKSFLADYPIRVIHNGIDLDVFKVYDAAEVRERYSLGNRKILLGVASIWSREKGLDDFIKMNALLNDDEVIVLVGVDEKTRKLLPEGIVAIERTENIGQLAQLYSAAEAFVNPTWQDNYPTVNLEAIACGTPVVTYRTGGSIEAVTEDTGAIVEQGDVEGLLTAVRAVASKGKGFYQPKCREHAVKNFCKHDRYADYIRLYDELLRR